MSEAIELFLRRVIIDERLPFEIVALDTEYLGAPNVLGEVEAKIGSSREQAVSTPRTNRKKPTDRKKN